MANTSLSRYLTDLTQEKVRTLLDYDPETGILYWKVDRSTCVRAGDIAGSNNGAGYISIVISGSHYLAHRLAWLWVTGEWPQEEIDHVNLIRDDNRWVNLREATRSQNGINSSRGGFNLPRGVWSNGRKFMARIGQNNLHLGTYDTLEEAEQAYVAAAQDLYGEFYNSGT